MRLVAVTGAVLLLCGLALVVGVGSYVSQRPGRDVRVPPVASLPEVPVTPGPAAPPVPVVSAPESQPVAASQPTASNPTATQDRKQGHPTPHGKPPR